jgi:hypothetical protein
MRLLNFAHPISAQQLTQIRGLLGAPVEVVNVRVDLDHARGFEQQIHSLLDGLRMTSAEWRRIPIVINLPGLATAAAVLLAQMLGRTGSLPAVVRMRPATTGKGFEVAEILDLERVREMYARAARWCRVGGWRVWSVPGTMYTFGGGAVVWGPYQLHEVEPDWDVEGMAVAVEDEASGNAPCDGNPDPHHANFVAA